MLGIPVKAELKALHSPDVRDLRSFVPRDEDCFRVFVEAMIGPEGDDSSESFGIIVCSPKALAEEAASGPVLGRHRVIMASFDYNTLTSTIRAFCGQCEGESWDEVGSKVARLGFWEFEDYREYEAP